MIFFFVPIINNGFRQYFIKAHIKISYVVINIGYLKRSSGSADSMFLQRRQKMQFCLCMRFQIRQNKA
nr:MAG TPA: hypothetical protein [Caudoviricetes sp.]